MIEAVFMILQVLSEFSDPVDYVYQKPKCVIPCKVETKECLQKKIEYRMINWEKCE